jgi:hypothetical protein
LNEWNQWNKSCIMLNILWYACLTVTWCARVLCLNVAEFHLSRFFVVCFQSLKKNLGAVFWKNVITNNQHSLFFIWFKDRDQLFLPNSGSPGAIKPLIIYLWIIIMIDFFFFFGCIDSDILCSIQSNEWLLFMFLVRQRTYYPHLRWL